MILSQRNLDEQNRILEKDGESTEKSTQLFKQFDESSANLISDQNNTI